VKRTNKILIIGGAYLAAVFIAWACVQVYIFATSGTARQSSQGMFAFGDSILFLAVLAVASIPASCITLYYLRRHRLFWRAAAVVALAIAVTGLYALLMSLPANSASSGFSALSPIRVLLAPMFGLTFLLAVIFSPARFYRVVFLSAFLIEVVVFISVVLIWAHPNG
jgi:hypothetical protein